MFRPYHFEKPLGMRDILPSQFTVYKKCQQKLETEMQRWGYQFVMTPTLEYYDTVGQASAILEQQLFKLLDREGRTVVLRPDMTSPIARVVASGLKDVTFPLRLAYTSPLFRAQQFEASRPAEFEQTGVEFVGDPSSQADAEVIALMIELLQTAGLDTIHIAIGHIGFVNSLFLDILGNQERVIELKHHLYQKNDVGYTQHIKSLHLSSIDEQRLLRLLQCRGLSIEETKQAISNSLPVEQSNVFNRELDELWQTLETYGVIDTVSLDLSLVNHLNYYTGLVFEGFGGESGYAVSSGGRYDALLTKFGRPAPATGFGIRLDRLMEAINAKDEHAPQMVIIYSQEHFSDALEAARQLRENNHSVVLQNIKGIQDVDAYTKQFEACEYFIGNSKRGERSS